MKKSILIIAYGELLKSGSAGTTIMNGLVQASLNSGYKVSYLALLKDSMPSKNDNFFRHDSQGELITGTQVYTEGNISRFKRLQQTYNHANLYRLVDQSAMLEETYDFVISFETMAYSIAKEIKSKNHLTIIADPAGERLSYIGLNGNLIKKRIFAKIISLMEVFFWKSQLRNNRVDFVAMFGSRHAQEWSKKLETRVIDLRPMVPEVITKSVQTSGNRIPVIVYGGSLGSSASRYDVKNFLKQLKSILNELFDKSFEVKIIGQGNGSWTNEVASWERFELVGEVEVFEDSLLSADIFIISTKYPVGVRTRICSALQAGCYCIIDPVLLKNMPELKGLPFVKSAKNYLEYESKIREFSKLSISEKNNLRQSAHDFYKINYSPNVASAPILKNI